MTNEQSGANHTERARFLLEVAPPCWQWHRPLTLCYLEEPGEEERNEIFRQGEIAGIEISRFNVVRYKAVGPAWVPRVG